MDDPSFITVMLLCTAATFGLIAVCARLQPPEPRNSDGGKP